MAGVIRVDAMSRAERDRLVQAISEGDAKPIDAEREPEPEDAEFYTPWYVRPLQVGVYVFAYSMLGSGWLLTHVGQAMFWIGSEAKKAARSMS